MIKLLFLLLALTGANAAEIRPEGGKINRARIGFTADGDAQDYFSRVATAGGTVSTPASNAYNAFVVSAKANGYWSKLLEVHPYHSGSIAVARVKLKNYPGTPTSLTNTGSFVNGDVLANGGIQGGGTKYFSTDINYTSITSGLGGLSFWVGDDRSGAADQWIMGVGNGSAPQMTLAHDAANTTGGRFGGTAIATIAGTTYTGFYHVERDTLSSLKVATNGVVTAVSTTTVTAATRSALITTFAGNSSLPFTGKGFFSAFDDGSFSTTDIENFARDVATLMVALGRVSQMAGDMRYGIIIGQSLSVGGGSDAAAISTTPIYSALTQGRGVISANQSNVSPETQGDKLGILRALSELTVESPASGLANQVGKLYRDSVPGSDAHDLVLTDWGKGATFYSGLKKTTQPYANSLTAIRDARKISPIYRSGSFLVPGIICVHGEGDGSSATYQADIEQWQSDYETDIKAITGQTGTIPIFHSQPSAWTSPLNLNTATALSPYAILAAHVANPTKSVLVCPKYILPYSDGVHLTSAGYRKLGEYYGKAWYQHIVQGVQWQPLRPVSVVRSGATITVSFTGRVGNLVLDNVAITDPGNFGFEWAQTGGTARTISTVALSGDSTQVIVTLSGDPGTPTTQRLRYAYTGTVGNSGGPTTGPRGCLRDSETMLGAASGEALYDWCVHFNEAVTP